MFHESRKIRNTIEDNTNLLCGEKCMAMEVSCSTKKSHKEWRRIAKNERRKRLRRKVAAEREADEERLRAALEKSADYLKWLERREEEEKENEAREREKHDQLERQWLVEEAKAQEEWQILQQRKLKARQLQLEQEEKIRQEFEAKQVAIRKKQEEEKRKREEDIRKREQLLKEIDDYIDNGIKTPEALREVLDSQPGKELCPFFTKTGACRYGDTCSRNHRRLCLSKVILVPGFYTHFSLEKNSAEYDTDVALEFESSETRRHFREFYKDVVPELESFGRIKTLKYCCNTEVHLRGNLYVEYHTEREAARALRRLKGRWYAGRQLNCEFANLKSWRSAVCGMSRCPKGRACNFLHTFKNPYDEYDIASPPRWTKQFASTSQETTPSSRKTEHRNKSKWEDGCDTEDGKNWRWSESPEPELEHGSKNIGKRHRHSDDRDSGQKAARDKRLVQSDRDRSMVDNDETSMKRHRSSSKRHFDDKGKDDNVSNGREYTKKRSRNYQRNWEEDNDYDASPTHYSKRHSRSRDRSHRSKRHKSSNKYCKREKEEGEKGGRNRRNRNQLSDGSSKRNIDDAKSIVSCAKSKWDKESTEQVDAESPKSSDSEFSNAVEVKRIEKSQTSPRTVDKRISEDEWATTDSESETKNEEI